MSEKQGNYSTDLRDLKHISWLAEHLDDYEFRQEGLKWKERFRQTVPVTSRNYISCTLLYDEFCRLFDNQPFRYYLGLQEDDAGSAICGKKLFCYLVQYEEKGIIYQVPMGYLEESGRYYTNLKDAMLEKDAEECRSLLSAVIEKSDEARRAFSEVFASGEMYIREAAGKLIRERILLFFAWLFCLLAMAAHSGLASLRSAFMQENTRMLWLKEMWSRDMLASTLTGAGLIVCSLILLVLSVALFRAHVAVLEKSEAARRGNLLVRLEEILRKNRSLLDQSFPAGTIKPLSGRKNVLQLLEAAAVRYRVTYPPLKSDTVAEAELRKRRWIIILVILYSLVVLGVNLLQ